MGRTLRKFWDSYKEATPGTEDNIKMTAQMHKQSLVWISQ